MENTQDHQRQPKVGTSAGFSGELPKTMKYEIELHKNEHKTVEVFAESPAAALQLAKKSNPGFKAESATEILAEDNPGKCFEVVAHCEGCDRPIFDGEKYGSDEDGVSICADCLPSENDQSLATAGAGHPKP